VTVEPPGRRLRHQLPLVAWLVVVWILLWGTWSWANLLSGLAVALGVMVLLPLPAVVGHMRVRPLPLVRFVGHFLVDLVVSGAQVAWRALGPGGVTQGAIVRVRLRADSDLLLTIVAETISLVPGSLVLDLDREERLISVHLLHAHDLDDVARQKADVLAVEERIVRAFGSAEDIAVLERETVARVPGGTPS
jgi:multicomponent Na+:H+ antiporter subunit E